MFFAKIPVSTLTAGVLALTVACSGASVVPPESVPPDAASVSVPTESVPSAPFAPAQAPNAGVAVLPSDTLPADALPAAPVNERALRKSPIQALNQMVTAQALLVSLLLAPLSKAAAEQPLARVDAPRATPAP
jgi:hypothetical protein